jgi:hypothetical protein
MMTLPTAIMQAADVLPCHPGPLADAKLHLSLPDRLRAGSDGGL